MRTKLLFLLALFLILQSKTSAQTQTSRFTKYQDNLYISGEPNTTDKVYIYGIKKAKIIDSNNCGVVILPLSISDESVPVSVRVNGAVVLDVTVDYIYNASEIELSKCVNGSLSGALQGVTSGVFRATNVYKGNSVLITILQPNTTYLIDYTASNLKYIKYNSCGFAKIIKSDYSVDSSLSFGLLSENSGMQRWSDIESKPPKLCLNSKEYRPVSN
jgi:hypothetical protein